MKLKQHNSSHYTGAPLFLTAVKGTLRCRLSYGYFSFIAKYASN